MALEGQQGEGMRGQREDREGRRLCRPVQEQRGQVWWQVPVLREAGRDSQGQRTGGGGPGLHATSVFSV